MPDDFLPPSTNPQTLCYASAPGVPERGDPTLSLVPGIQRQPGTASVRMRSRVAERRSGGLMTDPQAITRRASLASAHSSVLSVRPFIDFNRVCAAE